MVFDAQQFWQPLHTHVAATIITKYIHNTYNKYTKIIHQNIQQIYKTYTKTKQLTNHQPKQKSVKEIKTYKKNTSENDLTHKQLF